MSFKVVQDIAAQGAFNEAVRSLPPFEAVIHTASPFHFNIRDAEKDILDPAIKGATGILQAIAQHAPSVRRVVLSSSLGAMLNMPNHPEEYNERIWNPTTMEQAVSNFALTYNASKKFAELAAWDFMEKEKPTFALAVMNPPFVFGPVIHDLQSLENTNTSNKRILSAIDGSFKKQIPPTGSCMWVDVRDVARAHVRAIERPQASNHRFLLVSSYWTNKDLVEVIRENFPSLRANLPHNIESDLPAKLFRFDTKPSEEILGIDYIPFEQSVIDSVSALLEIDPALQRSEA